MGRLRFQKPMPVPGNALSALWIKRQEALRPSRAAGTSSGQKQGPAAQAMKSGVKDRMDVFS